MKNNLLWIAIISLSLNSGLILSKQLQDSRWASIAIDIAQEGDAEDRGEFEAAKQALLNIKANVPAKKAAQAIAGRWEASTNAEIKNEASTSALLALKRYPNMDANTIHEETRNVLRKPDINKLIVESGVTIAVPAA